MAMSNFRRRPDVRNPQQRVGRRLDPDQPRAPSDSALDFSDAGSFDEGKCEPEVLQHRPEEPVSATVDVARGDNVSSLYEQKYRGARRTHAGGKGEAVFSRLQARERCLERGARWIVGPRV